MPSVGTLRKSVGIGAAASEASELHPKEMMRRRPPAATVLPNADIPTERGGPMTVLATYTFGQALLTVLEFALLFLWIWIAIGVIADVFRSRDMSGWAKAAWLILIVLLPLLGVLIYLIARGHKMAVHAASDAQAQDAAFRQMYAALQQALPTTSPSSRICAIGECCPRQNSSEPRKKRSRLRPRVMAKPHNLPNQLQAAECATDEEHVSASWVVVAVVRQPLERTDGFSAVHNVYELRR